jgi:hypothetical protein
MPTPSRITDFSTTAASNFPTGSESVGTSLDDYLRAYQAVVALDLSSKGSDIASAATADLGAVGGLSHDITGTTTITGFGTVRAGVLKIIKFEGALTLTHNATSLILPGGANIKTADGDIAVMVSEGSGNWRCVSYEPASAVITNSLAADVSLNNTSSYFTGPTVAQGTSGTWFVSGTVTMDDSAGSADFDAKLWDGTTVIASARSQTDSASGKVSISLSGYINAPAGNLRISVKDSTSTSGKIRYDLSGNAKDSTITAYRLK